MGLCFSYSKVQDIDVDWKLIRINSCMERDVKIYKLVFRDAINYKFALVSCMFICKAKNIKSDMSTIDAIVDEKEILGIFQLELEPRIEIISETYNQPPFYGRFSVEKERYNIIIQFIIKAENFIEDKISQVD
jgi:hypothetical protein